MIGNGAFWVATLSLAVVIMTACATWHWWSFLSHGDTSTNVMRNVALIAGGLIAWIFAFWRSVIARQQADVAKEEHQHARFQRASELLAQQGLHNSHARISGLHAFRYLLHDAPDLGPEAIDIVTTFMVQALPDEGYDLSEVRLARMTAEFACDTMDRKRVFDAASRQRLRDEIALASSIVERRLLDDGSDPNHLCE